MNITSKTTKKELISYIDELKAEIVDSKLETPKAAEATPEAPAGSFDEAIEKIQEGLRALAKVEDYGNRRVSASRVYGFIKKTISAMRMGL